MQFEMWSIGHIIFMLSPALIMLPLYFLLRKKSQKTIYIVGVIIGVLSLAVITTRCIGYYITHGFHPQVIPLQICHFGNIMVFLALVFKSKTCSAIAWSLNMACAFSSLVLADSLAKYETIWNYLPQCYIWGHILIVVGSLYPIVMKEVRIDLKSYFAGLGVLSILLVCAIVLNSYFNDYLGPEKGWFINYFYIYNSKGVPFDFLYKMGTRAQYGWFTINWVYTIGLIVIITPLTFLIYLIQKLFYRHDKDYQTNNILIEYSRRHNLEYRSFN